MGTEAIGYVLGQQCAPVLAGIKPSNLLIIERGNQRALHHVLKDTEIRNCLLYASQEKDYWFLFDEQKLCMIMNQPENSAYLRTCGYDTNHMEAVLERLTQRFSQYKKNESGFPHEMGVLFGYPINDVRGFIENKGQNFKMSGYWKVYDDVVYAGKIFQLYKYVKQTVLDLCSQGVCIPDICRACRMAEYQV